MYFKRIKEIRLKLKKTQKEIADELKVSRSLYCKWENGSNTIPLKKLNDLCNYYNINIDYITGISNKKIYIENRKNIDKKIVGNNIKYIRKQNNITQIELSKLLNTTQSTISAYESGEVLILMIYLYKIARKYKCSIDLICDRI